MKTIEQKAKAYDKALERARQICSADRVSGIELTTCETIFPELAESEDEKIRETLIYHFGGIPNLHGIERDKIIAWLEKKGEQKQWKPSEEQIEALEHFVRGIGESGYASPYENSTKLIYLLLEQLKAL